jgi:cytochrome c oxidase subunit 2
MTNVWVIMSGMTLAIVLAACSTPDTGNSGRVETGRELFNTGGKSNVPCATCHSLDGSALVGPTLKGISQRAGTRGPGLSAEDYIRQSILSPSAFIVPGYSDPMYKDYTKVFTDDDIQNLIAFLMTQ